MSKLKTTPEFIREAWITHTGRYIYTMSVYINAKTHIVITCPTHGNFSQTPDKHLSGAGCIICGGSAKSDTTSFIYKASLVHSNLYTYSDTTYGKNNKSKVWITCKVHGNFLQTPANHLSGYGCMDCANVIKRKKFSNEATVVYVIRIFTNTVPIYKVGITLERIGVPRRYKNEDISYEIIGAVVFPTGEAAYNKEQQILKRFNDHRYKGLPVLATGGNSELLIKNPVEVLHE